VSGRYRALDARGTLGQFMQAGSPDAAAFESQIGKVVASDGRPVRVFGEMVALLWDDGDVMSAIELEAMWNDLGRRRPFTLYCAYPMSAMEKTGDLAAAKRVCDQHSHVVSMSAYPGGSAVETAADSGESRARMFVPTPPALRAVRRFVADVLCAWNADLLVDDASIVACELATNALRHAHSPFRICLSRSASVLRIAVRDASRDEPALLAPDPRRTGGRGIPLIAALSTAWGSVAETDGKTVWVELSI
jgi:hypothetical protein